MLFRKLLRKLTLATVIKPFSSQKVRHPEQAMSHSSRHLQNAYLDYMYAADQQQPHPFIVDGQISPSLARKIDGFLSGVVEHFDREAAAHTDHFSVYTGSAGVALFYLRLAELEAVFRAGSKTFDVEHWIPQAVFHLERCGWDGRESSIREITKSFKDHSFLLGSAGVCVAKGLLDVLAGSAETMQACVDILNNLVPVVLSDSNMPDEVLYGRAGFLYALLFAREKFGRDCGISQENIDKVVDSIIKNGVALSEREQLHRRPPLMFSWFDEHYVGAAHGIAGILYVLMKAASHRANIMNEYVRPTLDYLISKRYASGNYPPVLEDRHDLLVHWCHGAPGVIFTLTEAARIFSDKQYMAEAERAADVVWERGLLKKGYGLCHGVAGNAYSFLVLYQETQNDKHLHRAACFADFCCAYGSHGCRVADTPYSLFEGMAGTLLFLAEMRKQPMLATFPAYQLR